MKKGFGDMIAVGEKDTDRRGRKEGDFSQVSEWMMGIYRIVWDG